ncbi:MAG TPA: acetylornithine transaminase [Candidatus Avidehalobacter gallistercoris]|uniref:Acetylornithine aminotransferase n=1 Tax=Candidatus Avidehalobacter gallistercoris TaxID=2840694 RepID=A0A9D1HKH5_9FIRM|nr:acetylornithine transaminase [Candidatus Avidehalobacter gallistercoris]
MNNVDIKKTGEKYCMNVFNRLPIAMVRGEGSYVFDADGNKYLDFVAGIAVNVLGHAHPAVAQAISEQAHQLIHASNLYWLEPQVQLAQQLVENSDFDKVFFGNSGAEANEGAVKLARRYAVYKEHPERKTVITMKNSFHGRTLLTLTATGQDKMHLGFEPLAPGFKYAQYNNLNSVLAALDDETCAIMLEPVQGEGGVYPADKEFLRALRQLCDERDILLIYDEVQTGIGRTGKLFAYQNSGVCPDIITLAKALGGGMPLGAFMAKDRVAQAFKPGDHGSTFGGNPVACAAGLAVLHEMLAKDVPAQAAATGAYIKERLNEMIAKYSCLLEVRGEGLLLGLQLSIPGADIVKKCLERGLLINCTAGTVLRFIPPLNISRKEADEFLQILTDVLTEVCA